MDFDLSFNCMNKPVTINGASIGDLTIDSNGFNLNCFKSLTMIPLKIDGVTVGNITHDSYDGFAVDIYKTAASGEEHVLLDSALKVTQKLALEENTRLIEKNARLDDEIKDLKEQLEAKIL